jgi:signal transduction histidine kinase
VKRGSATGAPAVHRRGRFVGPLLAANVLVVGLTVTLLTVGGLRSAQRESAARVMDQRTAVARAAVTTETERYRSLLQTVAAGIGANPDFTGTDFDAVTAPLAGAGLLGATSVAYVVATPRERIASTQAHWRTHGAPDLVLTPAGPGFSAPSEGPGAGSGTAPQGPGFSAPSEGPGAGSGTAPQGPGFSAPSEGPGAGSSTAEHFFSIFARSLNASGRHLIGVDVAGSAEASGALAGARSTGQATVSDTYVLLRDRRLPAPQQQLSFVFVAPVKSSAPARPGFRGWVVMGLHGQDFLGGVLGTASQGQLDGELLATNGDGRQVRVAVYLAPGKPNLRRQETIAVANRQWTLITRADSAHLPGARSYLPPAVLLGGIVVTAMLAWLVHVLAGGRSRARWQVEVATAELRTAEEESRRQAGLLGAIMASLGDGVGVVDEHGAFLLHNPAAKALLGVADDVDRPGEWQSHYGLFRPDGRTPFPVEEMPLIRALAGESSDGVEMMVRNPGRPDGILLSVDGRPLDISAGRRGAVAVFHDITELRRYETDLAVFAGVVAHDLKAPLAVIRGHCETAADELADAPDGPAVGEARTALGRIAGGVDRMAGLIDTLLAYTTSRDAPLRLAPTPLGPLVEDVIAGRTGHLRPSDALLPEIYVGPLPDVEADPAMLRHVLDNLIGNSLKYVQPGRVARVDVTAGTAPPGWTRIEVADRGIGIPDADKPNIFESFHRAHTAAGYAGTGLGLAICRRIVERHGGVIGVADNPGGGTRFEFTLPLAGTVVHPPAGLTRTEVTMSKQDPAAATEPAQAEEDRAALERALAERAAIQHAVLPGLVALPPCGPSTRESSSARLQSPVPAHPQHHH